MKLSSAAIILGIAPATTARRLGLFKDPEATTKIIDQNALAYPTPTTPRPTTPRPTMFPTQPPTKCQPEACVTDYDCPRVCQAVSPYAPKQCVNGLPTRQPTSTGTPPPTVCPCKDPPHVPDRCEVDILIDEMEIMLTADPQRSAQLTRAAFHDAGTFDQTVPEGGANGCLLTHPAMRFQPENLFLDDALNSLKAVMDNWHAHPATCIDVSHADMLQFAIFYVVVRQSALVDPLIGVMTTAKRDFIKDNFNWGRPDETSCDLTTSQNLPSFQTPANHPVPQPLAARCSGAGQAIQNHMITLNGFTPEEATVLIGAHTIGMIRNTFGGLGTEWVPNGADLFTPNGPIFDNEYFRFIVFDVAGSNGNDAFIFEANGASPPFDTVFPTWFKKNVLPHSHFDTDVTLAFPSIGPYPDYSPFAVNFANDNVVFLKTFMAALDKMGRLGVTAPLVPATKCEDPCGGADAGVIKVDDITSLLKKLAVASVVSANVTRHNLVERMDEIKEQTTPSEKNCCSDPGSIKDFRYDFVDDGMGK